MTPPNFFIVGAPKCGTTALCEYLGDHPQAFMVDIKEPQYFNFDYPEIWRTPTLEKYLELYREATDAHRAIGEGSVWYLHSACALSEIHKFNPAARIIVMLRHPVDMLDSLHNHLLRLAIEDQPDFETAWRLQEERAQGRSLPHRCAAPELLEYRRIGMLGSALARVFEVFPRDQVHITLMDDMKADTGTVYRGTLDFLGLDDDGRTHFPPKNANMRARSPRLGRLLYNPPAFVRLFSRTARRLAPDGYLRLITWVRGLNAVPASRQPIRPEFREELIREFAGDIRLLETLLGRSLDHWLAPLGETTQTGASSMARPRAATANPPAASGQAPRSTA